MTGSGRTQTLHVYLVRSKPLPIKEIATSALTISISFQRLAFIGFADQPIRLQHREYSTDLHSHGGRCASFIFSSDER